MPDVVLVLLVELVVRHARAVHLAPERDGLVEREPDALGRGQRGYREVVRGRWALSDAPCLGLVPRELAPCSRIRVQDPGWIRDRRSRHIAAQDPGPESQNQQSEPRTQMLIQDPGSRIQSPGSRVHNPRSLLLPEAHSRTFNLLRIRRQRTQSHPPTHLEEQNQLQPPKVLQVMILLEPLIHVPHTRREMSFGNIIDHVGGDD